MQVTFLPENITISTEGKQDLLTLATLAGILLRSGCGGKGVCGQCEVIIKKGRIRYVENVSPEKIRNRVLACLTYPLEDLIVEIPEKLKIEKEIISDGIYTPIELTKKFKEQLYNLQPLAKKVYLELPKPTIEDNLTDDGRIKRQLQKNIPELKFKEVFFNRTILSCMSEILRSSNWKTTFTLIERGEDIYEIIKIEPGDTIKTTYGLAIDIGTTTVVVQLINLNSGEIIDTKATYNRQMRYGEDVITRMLYTEENTDGLKIMTETIISTLNGLINNIIQKNNVKPQDILAAEITGNTTMLHFFYGLQTKYIRCEPYIPVVKDYKISYAYEHNLKIHPYACVHSPPTVASYLGSDIVAGILATDIMRTQELAIFIDLGTNGEIVLGNKDWLLGCSCSAGTAFEGVGIKSGVRAMDGAIQGISIEDGKIKYTTINNLPPIGICGSGLVEVLSEFLKAGIIDRAGKFKPTVPRIKKNEHDEIEFLLVPSNETQTGEDIVITESDIANLIRSKGAVFMGIEVLLEKTKIKLDEIKKIYIAGGFGTYLNIEKAITIGLLPDINRYRFIFLGNSAIYGARMCLLSNEARKLASEISKKITYIELSVEPKFMNEYTSTLFLPHTNLDLFPSVKKIFKK